MYGKCFLDSVLHVCMLFSADEPGTWFYRWPVDSRGRFGSAAGYLCSCSAHQTAYAIIAGLEDEFLNKLPHRHFLCDRLPTCSCPIHMLCYKFKINYNSALLDNLDECIKCSLIRINKYAARPAKIRGAGLKKIYESKCIECQTVDFKLYELIGCLYHLCVNYSITSGGVMDKRIIGNSNRGFILGSVLTGDFYYTDSLSNIDLNVIGKNVVFNGNYFSEILFVESCTAIFL